MKIGPMLQDPRLGCCERTKQQKLSDVGRGITAIRTDYAHENNKHVYNGSYSEIKVCVRETEDVDYIPPAQETGSSGDVL
jgi:hypothetical protein